MTETEDASLRTVVVAVAANLLIAVAVRSTLDPKSSEEQCTGCAASFGVPVMSNGTGCLTLWRAAQCLPPQQGIAGVRSRVMLDHIGLGYRPDTRGGWARVLVAR
jgi:hypothetical protein